MVPVNGKARSFHFKSKLMPVTLQKNSGSQAGGKLPHDCSDGSTGRFQREDGNQQQIQHQIGHRCHTDKQQRALGFAHSPQCAADCIIAEHKR